MTFPWNMKIQKAQCTFMGLQILVGLVLIVCCVMGRVEIERVEEERREEVEYGFASPEVCLDLLAVGVGVLVLIAYLYYSLLIIRFRNGEMTYNQRVDAGLCAFVDQRLTATLWI